LLDDFRVYDDWLNASDILKIYGNGSGDLAGRSHLGYSFGGRWQSGCGQDSFQKKWITR
jgi:hypothetical protein